MFDILSNNEVVSWFTSSVSVYGIHPVGLFVEESYLHKQWCCFFAVVHLVIKALVYSYGWLSQYRQGTEHSVLEFAHQRQIQVLLGPVSLNCWLSARMRSRCSP